MWLLSGSHLHEQRGGPGTPKWLSPFAVVLSITACTASFLQFPLFGAHFAALGDRAAQSALARWNGFFILSALCFVISVVLIFRQRRQNGESTPATTFVTSVIVVIAGVVFEVCCLALIGYIRHVVSR